VEPGYAAYYRHLYEHHWWWRARERIILAHLERLTPPGGFGPILDVGCGDGLFFEKLAALGDPEGVEEDASLVTAAGRARGPIHVGPFDESFRPTRRYALILLLDVLEHFHDDRACLRRALDLLAPKGVIVITVPAFGALWTAHDDVNRHVTRYTKSTLARLAADAGLRIDQAEYLFQWTALLKLAVRAKEAVWGPGPELPPVPGGLLNGVLRIAALAEHALLHRLPVPFGNSLLVIGGGAKDEPTRR
jgi:SAM-dependent methyltransferase